MSRAFLLVMDSVGCGGAPDADQYFNGSYPDSGANTLAHIAQACAGGLADTGRNGRLALSTLDGLGLGAAVRLASASASTASSQFIPRSRWTSWCHTTTVSSDVDVLGLGSAGSDIDLDELMFFSGGLVCMCVCIDVCARACHRACVVSV